MLGLGTKSPKSTEVRRNEPVKTFPQGNDGIFAQLRHMRNELAEHRRVITDLKRDIARIEKKQYRDKANDPPEFITGAREAVRSGYLTNWG